MSTTKQTRPEWVGKAAKAVAALYVVQHVHESAEAHKQASEAKPKTGIQEAEEKIADIIHRHFQEHK